ncbi:MAG: hypothetical protein HN348_18930, partial [Proteobacteria bacterium]|nr:hypothetical protein [Pseudomonadota bacterium]
MIRAGFLSLVVAVVLCTTGCVLITPYEAEQKQADQERLADNEDTDGGGCVPTSEVCDGEDNNCSGDVDDVDELLLPHWYVDNDGDGWGSIHIEPVLACEASGYVDKIGDCDDNDAARHPGISEECDDIDNDCDGAIDEELPTTILYFDADSDGAGNDDMEQTTCHDAAAEYPAGFIETGGDCDDLDPKVSPTEPEVCNDKDDNCDGSIDEGLPTSTFYVDSDGDGWGDEADQGSELCEGLPNYANKAEDCDDADPLVNPDAAEICDGEDNDCADGADDKSEHWYKYYYDGDQDNYAHMAMVQYGCLADAGFIEATEHDCDDDNDQINPGIAEETCNEADDNCNGLIDEDLETTTYYTDNDGDGQGDESASFEWCVTSTPTGFSDNKKDCDDGDNTIYRGAPEICDGMINDCKGAGPADDGLTVELWPDNDGDGFGDSEAVAIDGCVNDYPSYVANNIDCDDSVETVNVALPFWPDEDSDGFGNDSEDPTIRCDDGGKWAQNNLDCLDTDKATNPGAVEDCGPDDLDCDGDPYNGDFLRYVDGDGDGVGVYDTGVLEFGCIENGYSAVGGDCSDTDDAIHPYTVEICGNGADDNCDGQGCLAGDNDVGTMGGAYEVVDDTGADNLGSAFAAGSFTDHYAGSHLELVVGAPRADTGLPDGHIYLVDAAEVPSGAIDKISSRKTTESGLYSGGTSMGRTLAAAGDMREFDDFPLDDLVVGAPYTGTDYGNPGATYIIFAEPEPWRWGKQTIWDVDDDELSDNGNFDIEVVYGDENGDSFGFAVDAKHDANG